MRHLKLLLVLFCLILSQSFAEVSWNFNRIFELKNSLIKRFINDNKEIINESDFDNKTLLCKAIQFNNDEIAEFLITSNAKLGPVDKCVSFPLREAIAFNRVSIFRLLLKHGAKARVDCKEETTDLFYAIIGYTGNNNDRIEIIKDLVFVTLVDQDEFYAIKKLFLKNQRQRLGLTENASVKAWKDFLHETGLKVNVK